MHSTIPHALSRWATAATPSTGHAGTNTGHHGENTNTAATHGAAGTDTMARWLGGVGPALEVLGLGVGSMIRGRR